uniref:DNA recombination and repair protein Rad51-like C-terminal domain-containing protein n=1 Tax=Chromera velia CCMP2878 TaxID=1169474 RepID=A0A0G4F7U1_9ALVE|eukprot:Cvel_15531.t1-p1 / transcript=Cvel_15531.t1 / gene=Cvel_15531 / organism=Chromera_velia_CCMP2878 / gene_product=hypothetical protein / transcript_product=hypothetical protein / location=Cvel_scaffold1153:49075-52179(-) / protein_length=649 / sequence_SO=supercontig / SO=protein_coding / is_pseudo=false
MFCDTTMEAFLQECNRVMPPHREFLRQCVGRTWRPGDASVFVGARSSGKTICLMDQVVQCLLPERLGGYGGVVAFLDCDLSSDVVGNMAGLLKREVDSREKRRKGADEKEKEKVGMQGDGEGAFADRAKRGGAFWKEQEQHKSDWQRRQEEGEEGEKGGSKKHLETVSPSSGEVVRSCLKRLFVRQVADPLDLLAALETIRLDYKSLFFPTPKRTTQTERSTHSVPKSPQRQFFVFLDSLSFFHPTETIFAHWKPLVRLALQSLDAIRTPPVKAIVFTSIVSAGGAAPAALFPSDPRDQGPAARFARELLRENFTLEVPLPLRAKEKGPLSPSDQGPATVQGDKEPRDHSELTSRAPLALLNAPATLQSVSASSSSSFPVTSHPLSLLAPLHSWMNTEEGAWCVRNAKTSPEYGEAESGGASPVGSLRGGLVGDFGRSFSHTHMQGKRGRSISRQCRFFVFELAQTVLESELLPASLPAVSLVRNVPGGGGESGEGAEDDQTTWEHIDAAAEPLRFVSPVLPMILPASPQRDGARGAETHQSSSHREIGGHSSGGVCNFLSGKGIQTGRRGAEGGLQVPCSPIVVRGLFRPSPCLSTEERETRRRERETRGSAWEAGRWRLLAAASEGGGADPGVPQIWDVCETNVNKY